MHLNLKPLWMACAAIGALASTAQAQQAAALPRADQIMSPYSSTRLPVDPCHDFTEAVKQGDMTADVLEDQKRALASYPPGVCASPGMAGKLFQSRFLQLALTAADAQPWKIWPQVVQQHSRLQACKTLDCLDKVLDASIAQLKPLYLAARQARAASPVSLCSSALQTLPVRKALQMLMPAQRKSVRKAMDLPQDLQAQTCRNQGETVLLLGARMSGNQVNGAQWLYQLPASGPAKQLLFVEDGPVIPLPGRCAGRADLMTSARVNAGEHGMSFYRFDGHQYRLLMSFTDEAVAADESAGDWSVARDVDFKPVPCLP